MGSVPKRRCARGVACYQVRVLKLEEPPKLRATRRSDICEKCEEELAGGHKSSSTEQWKDKVVEAIEAVYAKKSALAHPEKASLWDLFALDTQNGGWAKLSDFGEVFACLDAPTLAKLRDWLDENRDRAVERYGYYTWLNVRTRVGVEAWLAQLPPDMQLLPDAKDGLPVQIASVSTDGEKWDLNIPIRIELLRRLPRYFSERDYAKLLGMSRRAYRRMRDVIEQEGFTLDKFTPDVLDRIVRGKKRAP
jgi:hypothetical protein